MNNKDNGGYCLAHFALCACSILCLKYYYCQYKNNNIVFYGTFANILLFSIVGFIRYAIPAMHNSLPMHRFLTITKILTRNLALPCVVTYLYLMLGYSPDIAYVHLLMAAIPVLLYLVRKSTSPLTDYILAINIVSLIYISYLFDNAWGIGLAVCQFVNHFFLNQLQDNIMAPIDCLFVVGMCFFNIFAVNTLKNY